MCNGDRQVRSMLVDFDLKEAKGYQENTELRGKNMTDLVHAQESALGKSKHIFF